MANAGPAQRAPALILHMDVVAHPVRVAAGSDAVMDGDSAGKILTVSRGRFAQEAVDSVNHEVARFSQFETPDETTEVFLVEFDLLPRKAESKM